MSNRPQESVPPVDKHDTAGPRETPQRSKPTEGVPLARVITREIVKSPTLVMLTQPRSPIAERFRRLKTLLTNDPGEPLHVIAVTSAIPGEGKSTIAMNLALALAADEQGKVLLIDADTRRPSVAALLHPEPSFGLRDVVEDNVGLDHAILELKDTALKVLPAGRPASDSVRLLSSSGMARTMAEVRERFKYVVIDTPPVVPFADADVVGAHCDGLLVVVRSGLTPRPALRRALESITSTRVLGLVLNDARFNLADQQHHYDSYYAHYYKYDKKGSEKP